MFMKGYSQIKTQVKFNSDFHRDKNEKKKNEEAVHKADKEELDDMNEPYKEVLTHGHFAPIRKKINKIYKKIIEIKQF